MKIKKIVAGMVAGVMAASMMSIGASAVGWDLYISGAQVGNKTQDDKAFNATTSTNKFYDSCTTYTQTSINGWPAYATYYAYYYDTIYGIIQVTDEVSAYYATQSKHKVNLNHSFNNSEVFYVRHDLHPNGYLCGISGQVTLT